MAGLDQYNNFRMRNGLPLDNKYLNGKVPYVSVNEANQLIAPADRSLGLTVLINNVEYWWKDGLTDANLVFKSSGSTPGNGFSGNYADLTGKPALHAVATSGNYADLGGRPALAAVAVSGDYNDLSNTPTDNNTSFEPERNINVNFSKAFVENTFLMRVILRSSINIAAFNIGSSIGASDIWSGNLTADDATHTHDRTLLIDLWMPSAKTLHFSGSAGTGAQIDVWYYMINNIPNYVTP